jgi:SAM-dependent methyltransferase
MPLQLGPHSIPARTYPTFQNRPESLLDETSGKRKWDLIISKNLPDLKGKVVCDIGCNIGIFSLEMARLGAKAVHGFDRGQDIIQPNNPHLGAQSVAQQAYFVRNLYEAFHSARYPQVHFHEKDLMTMDFDQCVFDVFVACCVLYHLGYDRMDSIIKTISRRVPEVFLQANNGHGGGLGQLSSLDSHIQLLEKYDYRIIRIDKGPEGYPHPIVYARKTI